MKEKIPIKSLLKLKNYHKMMNYKLCTNNLNFNPRFVLSFSVMTNPVLMGMRGYKHNLDIADILLLFKAFCLKKRRGHLLGQGRVIGKTWYFFLT